MAETFFPWSEPSFPLGDAALWIVALVTALLAIPTGFTSDAVAIAATGVGAFVSGGIQQVSLSLAPVCAVPVLLKSFKGQPN